MGELKYTKRRFWITVLFGILVLISFNLFAVPPKQSTPNSQSEISTSDEIVILLHGALKSSYSMHRIDKAFQKEGYQTFNWNYDSNDVTVVRNAALLDSIIRTKKYDHLKMNFVTHSMGALIVRYYLEKYQPKHLGRLVMIAPPNQGSRLATRLQDFPPFKWVYRKTVHYLVTGEDAFAPNAGIPQCEFGIIAGGTGDKYGFTWYLPGDDDGTISVDQTHLQGASDFIVLHHIHSVLPLEEDTIEQTVYFIENGRFLRQQITSVKQR